MLCSAQSLELKTAVLDPIAAWQAEYAHAKVSLGCEVACFAQ